ncbi:helix-turn-helix transcriptional regulator [Vibrio fluvialis]|nr:AlpA family phage regulatory protein [Vibrio fluvialis]
MEQEGRFPARIKLGRRSVVWRLSDLTQWLDKQAKETQRVCDDL